MIIYDKKCKGKGFLHFPRLLASGGEAVPPERTNAGSCGYVMPSLRDLITQNLPKKKYKTGVNSCRMAGLKKDYLF
jgi:hypothetical protein